MLEGSGDADILSLIEIMTLVEEDLKSKTGSICREEHAAEEAQIKMLRQEVAMLVSMGNVKHPAWDSAQARSKISLEQDLMLLDPDTMELIKGQPWTQNLTQTITGGKVRNDEHNHDRQRGQGSVPCVLEPQSQTSPCHPRGVHVDTALENEPTKGAIVQAYVQEPELTSSRVHDNGGLTEYGRSAQYEPEHLAEGTALPETWIFAAHEQYFHRILRG